MNCTQIWGASRKEKHCHSKLYISLVFCSAQINTQSKSVYEGHRLNPTMDSADKLRLQKNHASILDDLSVDDVLVYLVQEGILNDDDQERIQGEKTRRDRVAKLLSMLPYRWEAPLTRHRRNVCPINLHFDFVLVTSTLSQRKGRAQTMLYPSCDQVVWGGGPLGRQRWHVPAYSRLKTQPIPLWAKSYHSKQCLRKLSGSADLSSKLLNFRFRGSRAYSVFREALQKGDVYSWLVEQMDKTDVTSDDPPDPIGPVKGWFPTPSPLPLFIFPHKRPFARGSWWHPLGFFWLRDPAVHSCHHAFASLSVHSWIFFHFRTKSQGVEASQSTLWCGEGLEEFCAIVGNNRVWNPGNRLRHRFVR